MYYLVVLLCLASNGKQECTVNIREAYNTSKECNTVKNQSVKIIERFDQDTKTYKIIEIPTSMACIKWQDKEKVLRNGRIILEKK